MDWHIRDDVQRELRRDIKRELRRSVTLPSEELEDVTRTSDEQVHAFVSKRARWIIRKAKNSVLNPMIDVERQRLAR